MKPTSLKVKMQSIAQNEMQNTMGGADVSAKLKTVVVIDMLSLWKGFRTICCFEGSRMLKSIICPRWTIVFTKNI